MNKNLTRLAARRNHLVELVAAQRVTLAQDIVPWHAPLALGDRSITAWHYIKRHPEWMIGSVLVLVAVGPGRVGSWLGRGLVAWQMLDTLRGSTQHPATSTSVSSSANKMRTG